MIWFDRRSLMVHVHSQTTTFLLIVPVGVFLYENTYHMGGIGFIYKRNQVHGEYDQITNRSLTMLSIYKLRETWFPTKFDVSSNICVFMKAVAFECRSRGFEHIR